MDELKEIAKKGPGRPKEPTTITVRIPMSLRERLEKHLDRLEVRMGLKANRASICRHALVRYLDEQEGDI